MRIRLKKAHAEKAIFAEMEFSLKFVASVLKKLDENKFF